MKTILLKCEECGDDVYRKNGEHNRSLRMGRKTFCCVACSTLYSNKKCMANGEVFSLPNEFIGLGSKKKEFSDFRPLLNRINQRKKTQIITLTLQDIKDIWEKQNGICVYTKIKLKLPKWNAQKEIDTASVDRKDTSIGYTKENCQIVSVMANFAKNDFSDADMKEFCKQIVENYNS
jgi:hypothetical protein